MTKKKQKLSLNTATIRELKTRLTDEQLKNVDGGRMNSDPPDSSRDNAPIC